MLMRHKSPNDTQWITKMSRKVWTTLFSAILCTFKNSILSKRYFVICLLFCGSIWSPHGISAFNLDLTRPIVHSHADIASMFGFTVSQFEENGVEWLIVGAPEARTPQPGVERPGAVYKCPVANGTECQWIPFDNTGHDEYNGRHISNKTLQWFGASLASSTDPRYIVACAPRFVYFTRSYTKREPVGACFLYDGTANNYKSYYPCKTEGSSYSQGNDQSMCQAGSSIDFTRDKIVVGAVGSFYWQGQLIVQDIEDDTEVAETYESEQKNDDSYRGYAVTVGDFYGNRSEYIAVSSPKSKSYDGSVEIFRRKNDDLISVKNLTGQNQIGEYFGYSLATGDFNNDGRDDLVVGAPFYMDRSTGIYELGHVYVFDSLDNARVIEGRQELMARFGSAVAAIGDVDDDGYTDLAVGAPYGGREQRGAVYIFQGYNQGIRPTFSQVIEARSISDTLMAFGFSLSGGRDQDRNEYPDLLVGAQQSAEAVLFRARPNVRVNVELIPNMNDIALDAKDCTVDNGTKVACYVLETCVTYTGKGTPSPIAFDFTWKLDFLHGSQETRVYFYDGTTKRGSKRERVSLRKDTRECFTSTVYLKEEIRDKLHPIWTQFNYTLIEEVPPGLDLAPIHDFYTSTVHKTSVEIEKMCGSDEICYPDLKLDVWTHPAVHVHGDDTTEIELTVMVENVAEGAYESTLYVNLPPGVTFINYHKEHGIVEVVCTSRKMEDISNEIVVCDVGNPLPNMETVKFTIRTDPKEAKKNQTVLLFDCIVNSTNAENKTDFVDNQKDAIVDLEVQADLRLESVSLPEQLLFNSSQQKTKKNMTEEELIGPSFVHRYVITNDGPSSLSTLATDIYWPETLSDGSVIFYLSKVPEITTGEGSCQAQILPAKNVTFIDNETEKDEEGLVESFLMTLFGGKTEVEEQTYNVGCTGNSQDKCKVIHCQTGAMARDADVIIEVTGRVHVKTVEKILKLYRGVSATSSATTIPETFPYDFLPTDIHPVKSQVATFVTSIDIGAGKKPLQWWIIALAVLGGLVLLIIIGIVMWKCGFFKRKKREDEEHFCDDDDGMASGGSPTNGETPNGKPQGSPPKVQVDPQSKNLYKSIPDDDF